MAEMIPESMPSGRPKGEELVFDVLKRLPENWLVYYEPLVAERYPDFILIAPNLGVLVIEVKGWRVDNVVEANDETIKMKDGNQVQSFTNPVRQARDYMFRVMQQCRTHPEFRELCHSSGPHEGRYLFPFGHVVFLSHIRSDSLKNSGLDGVFRDCRVVTRDVLDSWQSITAEAQTAQIKACFTVHWDFGRLSDRQVDVLRSAIHPDIVVGPQSIEEIREKDLQTASGEQQTIKILDWAQESYARKIGHGHRVLNGVAGSGKTILLLHRARWLSKQDPKKRILIVCFNRALSAFLKSEVSDCENVTASTFHQWAYSLKAKKQKRTESLQEFGLRVLEKIGNLSEMEKWDAILIDEAQDLQPSCFQCAVSALKEGEDGDLIVVADGNQGLYRPQSFRWIDVGVQARGRVIPLRKNYRNTDEIMDFAWTFASEPEEDEGKAIVSVKPVEAVRHGPAPLIQRAESMDKEVETIVSLVDDLLHGRWYSQPPLAPLDPSEIGVIYPRVPRRGSYWPHFFQLKERLEKLCPVVWLNDKMDKKAKDKVKEPGLKIQTVDTSKGLQYRAAILIWANLLPSGLPDSDEAQDRRKLYVALTRAQDYLAITYTGKSDFTEELENHWTRTFNL